MNGKVDFKWNWVCKGNSDFREKLGPSRRDAAGGLPYAPRRFAGYWHAIFVPGHVDSLGTTIAYRMITARIGLHPGTGKDPSWKSTVTTLQHNQSRHMMAKRRILGKRILLTGASSGIGWHLALQLAQQGGRLLVTARRQQQLAELSHLIHAENYQMQSGAAKDCQHSAGDCQYLAGDITDGDFRKQLIDQMQVRYGGLDILINNAGVGAMGSFAESSPQTLRQVMEVNFFAPAELIRLSLPMLRLGQDPIVVNVSSVLGHRAVPLKSEYCASKFALHGLSDSLRAELGQENIDLTLISPSTTDSDFFDHAIADSTQRTWKSKHAMAPQKVATASVRAICKGSHEVILTFAGKSLVLLDRMLPTIADNAMKRWGQ